MNAEAGLVSPLPAGAGRLCRGSLEAATDTKPVYFKTDGLCTDGAACIRPMHTRDVSVHDDYTESAEAAVNVELHWFPAPAQV